MQIIKKLLIISSLIIFSGNALASPGRVNKEGCHTDKETKSYHCHNKSSGKVTKSQKESKSAKKPSKKKAESKKKKEVENKQNTQ